MAAVWLPWARALWSFRGGRVSCHEALISAPVTYVAVATFVKQLYFKFCKLVTTRPVAVSWLRLLAVGQLRKVWVFCVVELAAAALAAGWLPLSLSAYLNAVSQFVLPQLAVLLFLWFSGGVGFLGVVAGCTWLEQLQLAVLLGNGQLVLAIAGVVRAAAPYLGLALSVASILPLCVALLCVLYALLGLLCSIYLIK